MDKKIELSINNRKYLLMYIQKYQRKGKLPKKIDIDEKLVYKFVNIQDYMLVALLKSIVDEVTFDVVMETQKIELNKKQKEGR